MINPSPQKNKGYIIIKQCKTAVKSVSGQEVHTTGWSLSQCFPTPHWIVIVAGLKQRSQVIVLLILEQP